MSVLALTVLVVLVFLVLPTILWLLWITVPGWIWILVALSGVAMLFDLRAEARRRARLDELERFERAKARRSRSAQ